MSWQGKFDAAGPSWDGNADALAEEKRMQELMRKASQGSASPTNDRSLLKQLDQEMFALYEKEKSLLNQLGQCSNAEEKVGIENAIHAVRTKFGHIKGEYVQIRKSQR